MLRNYLFPLSAAIVLFGAVSLTACKSEEKRSADAKQQLVDDIAHYGIDPVDTTGKAPLASPEANDVLCKYPEFYHAVERVKNLHAKWAGMEREMIAAVFAGKSGANADLAKGRAAQLDSLLETLSITSQMDYVLFGSDSPAPEKRTSDKATAEVYTTIMATIADGVSSDARHAATDEMKTAVGHAARTWSEYVADLQKIAHAVPDPARARYMKAVNNLVRQHHINLLNRYYPYYQNDTPAWLLSPEATDDEISHYTFQGLKDRDWLRKDM